MWGSPNENIRGEILEEWSSSQDLRLANVGDTPICIRHNGVSIVDLTWVSPNLLASTLEWHVHTDRETLSDHRHISYTVLPEGSISETGNSIRMPYLRWAPERAETDIFEACVIA